MAVGARAGAGATAIWLRRFFNVVASSVVALALTGIALSIAYIGSPGAAIGTSYGAMVLAKIAIFAALLVMAWLNHRAVRRPLAPRTDPVAYVVARGNPRSDRMRAFGGAGAVRVPSQAPTLVSSQTPASGPWGGIALRRRLEVECGLAVVAVVLAASIGSTPPAVSAGPEQATWEEITRVLGPGWPRLQGPSLAELEATSALGDPDAPRTPEEKAWSEFGHNVSGVVILVLGVLATLEGTRRVPWARHWPLLHRRVDGLRGLEPRSRGLANRAGGLLGAPAESRGASAPAHARDDCS